jgi:shikimate dehydrogenase
MAKSWDFLQHLVFNFGAELASNPTQYMMECAFRAHELNWRYVQFEFEPDKLGEAVQAMRLLGFHGGNCTIPYKVAITEHLDRLGDSARLMGAVNCVVRDGDHLVGENTDGKGFLQSFAEIASPTGKSVVILGAGGAARAIAVELALAGARQITVVNRNEQRGQDLVSILSTQTKTIANFVKWQGDYVVDDQAEAVINATSIGMSDPDARVPLAVESLNPSTIVADVIVNPPNTRLIREARQRGCTALDGLGMVVNQAAIAFNFWTGFQPDADVMRRALQEVLMLD